MIGVVPSSEFSVLTACHSLNEATAKARGLDCKEPACNAGEPRFGPWVGKIPWRRERQPTPAFVPGESHGQRNLAGYSPWGHRVGHD